MGLLDGCRDTCAEDARGVGDADVIGDWFWATSLTDVLTLGSACVDVRVRATEVLEVAI